MILERRRALLAARDQSSWDGKECVAVNASNGNTYISTDYGKTFVASSWNGNNQYVCVVRSKNTGNVGAHIFCLNGTATSAVNLWWGRMPLSGGTILDDAKRLTLSAAGKSICANGDGTIIYVPTNEGSSWQTGYTCKIHKITRSSTTFTDTVKGTFSTWDQAADYASACSHNGQYAVIGGASGFTNGFQTVNSGETWTECLATSSFGNGITNVSCNYSGYLWDAVGPGGKNYRFNQDSWNHDGADIFSGSVYSGAIGQASVTKPESYVEYVSVPSGLYVYVGAAADGQTEYPTHSWTKINSTPYSMVRCNRTGNRLIGIYNGHIYYSWNWGKTWTQSSTPSGVTFKAIDMTKCD